MKNDKKDTIGEKCVKDQEGNMAFDNNSKAKIWRTHYFNVLNVEFPWNYDDLSNEPTVHGPPMFITEEMVFKAISQMKKGKATGLSGVALKMILAPKQHIVPHMTKLANNIVVEGKIHKDWNLSHMISCFKGKSDLLVMGNYRELKLLDHVMKNVEHVIESFIKSSVNINEMQHGFMPGRGTMEAIFILRQLQKNISEKISHSVLLS